MSFIFDTDINYIFTFCKKCWDFKKFVFREAINFDKNEYTIGLCTNCNKEQNINLYEAKDYYLKLNNNNY
ncbi:hypothetical protein SCORR_v1c08490 [Spiroplasma corruscae]|uniref:Uncharacterized protein n=1 Tax=Spiroplasma corruscae TaxID=216934 RepID=A0A222EQE2_9MOLU|nr:hypothetical protein [Spiroplasma corruscae]ASP28621.1 hypothetical protein SCORR_v1c08490 [Spiroplasma corruscae]